MDQFNVNGNYTEQDIKEILESKISRYFGVRPEEATKSQVYKAVILTVKDMLTEKRSAYRRLMKRDSAKRVYYMCMEFLIGPSLKNNLRNLGIEDAYAAAVKALGCDIGELYEAEPNPGLGNGGLGRLAACFMDSLTAQDYAATGYSLLYENGLFRQKIVDGEQVELSDEWLASGGVRLVPRTHRTLSVKFGGKIEERWENGKYSVINYDYDEVNAVPYDILIPGTNTNAVNVIRLWRAKPISKPMSNYASQGSYVKNFSPDFNAESITKQLYPPDNYDGGKLLRLTQQYFLVSASLQNIINDYLAEHGTLAGFEDNICIHINDTHPALCIPELMRILMDQYGYTWDDAWSVVVKCVSYTNHTVLPEALECWRLDLFGMKLPRILMIVNEINRRFTADLWNLYPGDWDRISRMAIVAYNQVRMANLSIVGSHTVNGVSALHSDILKKTIFHDFYKMTPWKFTNVTNGVVHRRWLNYANPALTGLLTELIGEGFKDDGRELIGLEKYKDDKAVLARIAEIKHHNKETFAYYAYNKTGKRIDTDSIFDVQIKRMHEYKRQLLNVLKIMSLYTEIMDNPNTDIPPQTFIFGCKAAPSYVMAKKLIKLIWFLSEELEKNPLTRDKIKIVFMEEYNVSLAEVLIPSADISEQISLAGKEASGTGCMKLMMNGAVTMGTMDGANVEIYEACGKDNIYIFGLETNDVDELWKNGYNSRKFYHNSEHLRRVVDRFYSPIGGQDFSHIADYLINSVNGVADPFMCLADFDSYTHTYRKAMKDYADREKWSRMSLMNTATSGVFASDNSIRNYADNIWHATPINKIK